MVMHILFHLFWFQEFYSGEGRSGYLLFVLLGNQRTVEFSGHATSVPLRMTNLSSPSILSRGED
jgi:hypothetical protein